MISGGDWLIDMKPHDVFNNVNFENVHTYSTTSATRNRRKESLMKRTNPMRRSRRQASSPLSARVSGTSAAVLTDLVPALVRQSRQVPYVREVASFPFALLRRVRSASAS